MPYPNMTEAQIYATSVRHMAQAAPAHIPDWRRCADNEWLLGLADFIESQEAEKESLEGKSRP